MLTFWLFIFAFYEHEHWGFEFVHMKILNSKTSYLSVPVAFQKCNFSSFHGHSLWKNTQNITCNQILYTKEHDFLKFVVDPRAKKKVKYS